MAGFENGRRGRSPDGASLGRSLGYLALTCAFVLAVGCDRAAPKTPASSSGTATARVEQTVGPEGARITVGGYLLEIPPGALSEPTLIDCEVSAADAVGVTPILTCGPHGTRFALPVRLTLQIPRESGISLATARGVTRTSEGESWQPLPDSRVDVLAETIGCSLWHFSQFAATSGPELSGVGERFIAGSFSLELSSTADITLFAGERYAHIVVNRGAPIINYMLKGMYPEHAFLVYKDGYTSEPLRKTSGILGELAFEIVAQPPYDLFVQTGHGTVHLPRDCGQPAGDPIGEPTNPLPSDPWGRFGGCRLRKNIDEDVQIDLRYFSDLLGPTTPSGYVLDCDGHWITGRGAGSGAGVLLLSEAASVHSCHIANFDTGIDTSFGLFSSGGSFKNLHIYPPLNASTPRGAVLRGEGSLQVSDSHIYAAPLSLWVGPRASGIDVSGNEMSGRLEVHSGFVNNSRVAANTMAGLFVDAHGHAQLFPASDGSFVPISYTASSSTISANRIIGSAASPLPFGIGIMSRLACDPPELLPPGWKCELAANAGVTVDWNNVSLTGDGRDGIVVQACHGCTLEDNTVTGARTGIAWTRSFGTLSEQHGTIRKNTIGSSENGILLEGSAVTVAGNTVHVAKTALSLLNDSQNNAPGIPTITLNDFLRAGESSESKLFTSAYEIHLTERGLQDPRCRDGICHGNYWGRDCSQPKPFIPGIDSNWDKVEDASAWSLSLTKDGTLPLETLLGGGPNGCHTLQCIETAPTSVLLFAPRPP